MVAEGLKISLFAASLVDRYEHLIGTVGTARNIVIWMPPAVTVSNLTLTL